MATLQSKSWLASIATVLACAACEATDPAPRPSPPSSPPAPRAAALESAPVKASAHALARGRELYDAQCAVCHGAQGRGDGTASYLLSPKPRDFSSGRFRLVSTDNGVPSDADLVATLRRGMPGSAMPPWEWMSGADLASLAQYVRELAVTGKAQTMLAKAQEEEEELSQDEALAIATGQLQPGTPLALGKDVESSAQALARGRQLFVQTCALCHGLDGRGQGVKNQWNEDGTPNQPRDLTAGILKGGSTERDIACRIRAGLPGSPMPATTSYSDEELRSLAAYVRTLIPAGSETLDRLARQTIRVTRTHEALPRAPADPAWNDAQEAYVGLMPLWWRDARVNGVRLRALHDGRTLAVRLTWEDATRDEEILGQSTFTDAAALQFSALADAPLFTMGSTNFPVNIWQWKAAWERDLQSVRDVVDRFPSTPSDTYAHVATADEAMYLTARAVHNIQSVERRTNAGEALKAEGFGTLAPLVGGAPLTASGTWNEGFWEVVFVREMSSDTARAISFAPGARVYVALGVWNGSAADRNGQKSVTVWHALALDP